MSMEMVNRPENSGLENDNRVSVVRGDSPIILGLPHTGLKIPETIAALLNENGQSLSDTDWHIDRLYHGLVPDVTLVTATHHRYVVDVNRNPSGESLYPGQNTTTLVPLIDFDGKGIWLSPPSSQDVLDRKQDFHTPYHDAMAAEIQRIKKSHNYAILLDCHSIRSDIPFLFEGTLPDFNIGTNNGTTCDSKIEKCVVDICQQADGYSTVVNGRFKGGWTTRHYGDPNNHIHAIQMELAQSTYLQSEKPPYDYDAEKAEKLRLVLRQILMALQEVGRELECG